MAIVESLLDTDFYKLTMLKAVLYNYPDAWVVYKFKCRNEPNPLRYIKGDDKHNAWLIYFMDVVNEEIDHLCTLRFKKDELEFLSDIRFFMRNGMKRTAFIEYLRLFQFNREYVDVYLDDDGIFSIKIEGPWISTIGFEDHILYIVSEVYGKQFDRAGLIPEGRERIKEKLKLLETVDDGFKFSDFGTRRRFSRSWHKTVLESFLDCGHMVGTSNVMFAKELGILPIGTMAHEWLQAHQAFFRVSDSQKIALDVWSKEWDGELGIALSDVVGIDAFLRDFGRRFALQFDGCRHDSGDPYDWCAKLINHYKALRIDPKTKSAVFSDGLTFEKAIALYRAFHNSINVSFGIGTNLTNDVGITPLQVVLKMVSCNGKPVAKISDDDGKGMCEDPNHLRYLKSVFGL